MHDAITVGVPVLAILFGILLNQRGLDKLETKMDARFNQVDNRIVHMEGRIDRIQTDLQQFYRTLAA